MSHVPVPSDFLQCELPFGNSDNKYAISYTLTFGMYEQNLEWWGIGPTPSFETKFFDPVENADILI